MTLNPFGANADLHVHTLLKYIQNAVPDLWDPIGTRNTIYRAAGVQRATAADFESLAKGEVQLAFVAMTPPEQKTFFFRDKQVLKIDLPPELLVQFASFISRIPTDKVREFQAPGYNHFAMLIREQRTYEGGQELSARVRIPSLGKVRCRYNLINSYQDLKANMDANAKSKSERIISVALTIESAHALGSGHIPFNGPNPMNADEATILKRVDALKGIGSADCPAWPHSPIWITMTHAFNNDICGFAQALEKKFRNLLDFSEPYTAGNNPPRYVAARNTGLTPIGKKVVERMLGIDAVSQARAVKGRRIVVDIKHMSTRARKEYYDILDAWNALHPEDPIPVLMSHAAVNGKPLLNENNFNPEDTDESAENSNGFNPWSINLYDEEIVRIHKSKGVIGLIFYQPILAGGKRRAGHFKWSAAEWANVFGDQIEYMVKTVYASGVPNKQAIWDYICIGSDFDGQINPVDQFATADKLPNFRVELHKVLQQPRFNALRTTDAATHTDKICGINAALFLQRYFPV
jgi:microsomal dipeptidase-like Zn-dependent dipeptidase